MIALKDEQTSGRIDRRLMAAVILVTLILLAAIVVAIVRTGDGARDPAVSDSTAIKSSACGLPDGRQTPPTLAPATNWYFAGKIAAPKSRHFGPAIRKDGLATCFARSPSGALFAAATIAAETSSNDAAAETAARARIVPGELLDKALRAPTTPTGVLTQIAGFKIEDYTPSRMTLTLATRISSGPNAGALGATPMTLVWRDGDWWWELQSTTSSIVLNSLDGFIEWSGVA